jgi:hypothetical protein
MTVLNAEGCGFGQRTLYPPLVCPALDSVGSDGMAVQRGTPLGNFPQKNGQPELWKQYRVAHNKHGL